MLSQTRQARLAKRLIAGIVLALVLSMAWSGLGLGAFVLPRQRALATELRQSAVGEAQLHTQMLELQQRCQS